MCTVCLRVVSVVGRDDGYAVSDAPVLIYADAYPYMSALCLSLSLSLARLFSHTNSLNVCICAQFCVCVCWSYP